MKEQKVSEEGKRLGLKCTHVRCTGVTKAGKRCKKFVSIFAFQIDDTCDQHRGFGKKERGRTDGR